MTDTYVEPTSYDDATTPPAVAKKKPPPPWGAQKPSWWKKDPPEPDLGDVLEAAESERADHLPRVEQGYRMLQRLTDPEDAGVFERLIKKVIRGEVEKVKLPDLWNETTLAIVTTSLMDWVPQALYRSSLDRDKAAAKEDLCAYLAENAQRQYSRSGGAILKAAKAFNLWVFGCVAEFNGVDVDNDECGLRMRLLDPQVLFPIWEGERGLSCVYSKYRTTAADFIGTFGSMEDFDEDIVRETAQAGGDRYDPHYLGEVTEYWDRKWCLVAWEEKEALLFAHDYYEVPMTITLGNVGQPVNISTPGISGVSDFWTSDRAEDLKRLYMPFLEYRLPVQNLKEANAGIVATKLRVSINPPRTYKAGVLTFEEETPDVKSDEGSVNKIRAEEEMEVDEWAISLDAQVTAAAFSTLQQAEATSTPSAVLSGQAPMSQGSGTAFNVLARTGMERYALYTATLAMHETMGTEQRLRFIRDFGSLLGMDGTIYVPRRGRPNQRVGQSAAHEVTSDLLKETGIRVSIDFRRFNPSELPSYAQSLGMLRSINMISRRRAIEIAGFTDDVDREMEDIDREMLMEVPEIAQVEMYEELIKDMQEAAWRGDEGEVEKIAYQLMYVASRSDIERTNRETEAATSQQQKLAATLMPSMNGMTGQMNLPTGTEGGNTPGPNTNQGLQGPAPAPPVRGM